MAVNWIKLCDSHKHLVKCGSLSDSVRSMGPTVASEIYRVNTSFRPSSNFSSNRSSYQEE